MTDMTEKKDLTPLPEGGEELFEVPELSTETGPSAEAPEVQSEPQEPVQEKPAEVPQVAPQLPVATLPPKDLLVKDIEEILSSDLTDMYLSLPDDRKAAFRAKGEEVAQTIHVMMIQGKMQVQKVLKLIIEWLQLIPGVNKFFLEQEAKIKTDTIMERFEQETHRVDNALV
ncbi:MAG: hypothetical protein WCT24_01280 [Patescibacteria group bacterium]|jgi:hypothetical protein